MNSTLLLILFTLFLIDVVGADFQVSMIVGDSVTLHTDIEVQKEDVIKWFFKKTPIAEINEGSSDITASDVEFKARLQLDSQTGDLKIRNINTIDSGDYKLEISRTGESPEKIFNVNVLPDDEVRSVTLMVGDSVTLHTGRNKKQGDAFSLFRGTLIYGEGLGGRLKLDNQTGSLTITNITTTDSGPYDLQINSSSYTVNRRIAVTVIDAMKSPSVKEGDSVALPTVTETQNNDLIQWLFGNITIGMINQTAQHFLTYNGPVPRFRHRLELDHKTRSLNITNIKTTDSGHYDLKISSSRCTINRRIIVTVTGSDIPSGLSAGSVAGIVIVILVVAAVATLIYFKSSKQKRITKENGQNHKKQDTDDPDEETKLGNDP